MKFAHNLRSLFVLTFLAVIMLFSACSKSKITPNPTPTPTPPTPVLPTRAELTKDSIYLYAQQVYFWNAGMPTYETFNPRGYASNQAVLNAIKVLPSTGKPTDKYSFLDEGGTASAIGGAAGDFGTTFFYNNAPSSDLRIKYVYPGSPADVKGLKRGDRVTAINGRTDLSSSNSLTIDAINAALSGSSMNLTVSRAGGTPFDVTVSRGSYVINPVLYSNTYTIGGKKIGYIVFNSFTTNALPKLEAAFATFATENITEVVVDLRYNGGGSVATAENLTDLIAPASKTGSLMYTTFWTTTMQNDMATILTNQKIYANGVDGVRRMYSMFDYGYKPIEEHGNVTKFAKKGSVNGITRAYFLVTGGTASASELVINNLRPIMDVKLIGRTTYGKPVGFYAIHIDKIDLYVPQFQTRNAVNFGDYFNGMAVDVDLADDVTKDFGDVTERYLAYALNYALKGNFTMSAAAAGRISTLSSISPMAKTIERDLSEALSQDAFKGMVDYRLKLKK